MKARSRILEHGYINIYSELNTKEKGQIFYNREYKKLNPNWDNTTILLCKKFEDVLKELSFPQDLKVLDAGCGNGNYVIDEFREKINLACGVDVDQKSTTKNICLDEIRYSPLEKIPYADNTFDVVLSLWVIEHLKDPKQVFLEIERVLKPGGVFIFATPNKNCLLLLLKSLFGGRKLNLLINEKLYGRREEDVFGTYYKANTKKSLERVLKESGFEGIDLSLNYDPGYTSFNSLTFKLSNFLDKFFEPISPQLFKQHLVGMSKKQAL